MFAILSTTTNAQTRRRSTARRGASSKAADKSKSAADIKAGAAQISTQLKTMIHFVYLYGGVVKGIAAIDAAASRNEASQPTIAQNNQSKARVRDSIKNVREGLDKLESDFRFHPVLRNYYQYLDGVARTGEAAENQAAANHFDEAGRLLLKVIDQLTDALAAMR
jgi:uncharacterized phage infection (PIP) family protein YhgE